LDRHELKTKLKNLLLKVCNHVNFDLILPQENQNIADEFPNISIVFNTFVLENGVNRGKQSIDLICLVRDESEYLSETKDLFLKQVFGILYKNHEVTLVINEINESNVFANLGIDAGINIPYGGFRINLTIPQVMI